MSRIYSVGVRDRGLSEKFTRESAGWLTHRTAGGMAETDRKKMILAFGAGAAAGFFARGAFWWVVGGLAAYAVVKGHGGQ